MKISNLKIASLLISSALVITSVGCGKLSQSTIKKSSNFDFKGYPIETSEQLSYWVTLNGNVASTASNLGDTPFGQELQKKTGVNIKFIHPPAGQEKDQFNIMLASDDLPDIVEYDWFSFPGGPEKALAEQYIIKTNDIFKNSAPNVKKYLNNNPEYDKMVKTDSGNYYGFPFFRGDDSLLVFSGPVVRQDWLNELNIKTPETIEDWYNMLKVFKDKKGALSPLSFPLSQALSNGEFVGAYGITKGFYVQDGNVKFGPIQPEYKEFLTEFAKWYKEGLIDNNIANIDTKALDANILNDRTGASVGYAGSGIGKWMNAMKSKNDKFSIMPTPHIVLNKGDIPKFGQKDYPYTSASLSAITTKCKNVELAARFLDYGYSEEGNKLFNFGIEGVSYNMENGYPKYTDIITKNPDGLSISVAMCKYIRGSYSGPFVQAKEYAEQYYALPEQKAIFKVWGNNDIGTYQLPKITPLPEESSEIAKIMNDVNTNVDEMTLRFITGLEPIENFDAYVENLQKFNIEKATKLYQGALKRYEKR